MNSEHEKEMSKLKSEMKNESKKQLKSTDQTWKIKCQQEKDEVKSEQIEKCLGQT